MPQLTCGSQGQLDGVASLLPPCESVPGIEPRLAGLAASIFIQSVWHLAAPLVLFGFLLFFMVTLWNYSGVFVIQRLQRQIICI